MGSMAPSVPERELRAEEELRELKAQLEEAGFTSVSHIRQEYWDTGAGEQQWLEGIPLIPAVACPSQCLVPPGR